MLESGKPVTRMAQEIDIKENMLYNGKKRYQDKAGAAFSKTPHLSEQELEIRHLKAKIVELGDVLPTWRGSEEGAFFAVMPPGPLLPAKTRVFVDEIVGVFSGGWKQPQR
ncbi:transposase [Pectobacterium odoriferum]|uniref:transposase n=1 Tax=Pectobacterium odoriferum TaxID=78398 RepID=UPI002E23835A|nr:transposase [Pectobacterium odoriferum]